MSPLQRALIEKLGHDNGFEYVADWNETSLILASAKHLSKAQLQLADSNAFLVSFIDSSPWLISELTRALGTDSSTDGHVKVHGEVGLAKCLRRASDLSRALPSQAEADFQKEVATELEAIPPGTEGTEVTRMVRQRLGQSLFREALLTYWGGACAVTGIAFPEVLRASHAKAWAECVSDAERLNVFNGFLLSANLDALFDRYLISFDDEGRILISKKLSESVAQQLGLGPELRLRWLAKSHLPFLQFHRDRLAG